MGKYLNKFALLSAMLILNGPPAQASIWQPLRDSAIKENVRVIQSPSQIPSLIFFGTEKALYRLDTSQHEERAVLYPKGGPNSRINDLLISSVSADIFAATDAGVYKSSDLGLTWDLVFHPSDERARQCISLWETEDRLWIGTKSGLFYQSSGRSQWEKPGGELSNAFINSIEEYDQSLYVATDHAVYRLEQATLNYTRIMTLGLPEELLENSSQEDNDDNNMIRDFDIIPSGPTFILASKRGIFLSHDQGRNWIKMSLEHISEASITTILPLTSKINDDNCGDPMACLRLVIGTTQGAFLYEKGRSIPLYKGMETSGVNELAVNERGQLFAAMEAGLYSMDLLETLPIISSVQMGDYNELKKNFNKEPDILEVHRLAIHYADVHNTKIDRWKKQARMKALLPTLSAGVDRTSTELLHWDTGQNPDILAKGRDFLDWDASVSWDLSDLVWSTDQTTIDSRAKLMVEMRENILDQITRLYFERRRLQMELLAMNDPAKFEKQMRIEELTALIDALTGGEFSRKIDERRRLQ